MKNGMTLFTIFLFFSGHLLSQDFSKVEIKAEKISDNIYALFGSGGNIGVLAGEDGFVLVDDQFAPLSEKIKAALAEIGKGSINYTINTHYHYDHADGNKVYGPEGALIVAHANTRKRLMQENTITLPGRDPRVQEVYPKEAWPKVTFEKALKLHLNGQTVRIFHPGNAHTDTDAIIYFEEANVMHTGDVFVRYGIPFIDGDNGGSIGGMIKAMNQLIEIANDQTVIIPGHGQLAKKQDMVNFRDMLQDIWDQVAAAKKAGKSLEDIQAADPTQKYQGGNMGKYVIGLIYGELGK
jgi:glyoxylase-like metal-dependent hydrolase (beta-lactamase superfamily II)